MNFFIKLIFSKAARYDSLSQFALVDVNNGQGNLDSNKKGKHAVRVLPLACEQSSCIGINIRCMCLLEKDKLIDFYLYWKIMQSRG